MVIGDTGPLVAILLAIDVCSGLEGFMATGFPSILLGKTIHGLANNPIPPTRVEDRRIRPESAHVKKQVTL